MEMRYGENPYQQAKFYRDPLFRGPSVATCQVLGGKQLSYNNILDLDAALGIISEFADPTAAIIKHTNPSGVAVAEGLVEAFTTALDADRMSAYGGIAGLNQTCDMETAGAMKGHFFEAIIAPDYEPEALEFLKKKKKNLRICSLGEPIVTEAGEDFTCTKVRGGMLAQTTDFPGLDPGELKVVTEKEPTGEELVSMEFAVRVCRHIRSNSILLVKGRRTVGVGAGQMSRVDASMLAAYKAGDEAKGSVMASDAFFPFRDGIDEAAKAGVRAIVQPGGSIRDDEVIQAANEHGMAMVFSNVRLFKH
jgi:phosphoribosylaminoimidazolecarboxamide formyltransferase/IMP cyclohydrolase